MKREDYLLELKNNLGSLSPQEVQDVLDYFTEYFEEKNDDEKVIAELGSPLEAAREILKNMEKDASAQAESQNSNHQSENETNVDQDSFEENVQKDFQTNFGKNFQENFQKNFQENFQKNFRENFLKHFLKNFTFSVSKSDSADIIELDPILLENLTSIILNLEDENLSIFTSDLQEAQLTYRLDKKGANQAMPYTISQGQLHLFSDDDLLIQKIILEIPRTASLSEIRGQLDEVNLQTRDISVTKIRLEAEDSNLSLEHLQAEYFELDSDDCNLSLSDSQLSKVILNLEDTNGTIQSSSFATLEIEADDCNLSSQANLIESNLLLQASDCYLSREMERQTVGNLSITASDSSISLPEDLIGQVHKNDDDFSFIRQVENASSQTSIRCEDCSLTIL